MGSGDVIVAIVVGVVVFVCGGEHVNSGVFLKGFSPPPVGIFSFLDKAISSGLEKGETSAEIREGKVCYGACLVTLLKSKRSGLYANVYLLIGSSLERDGVSASPSRFIMLEIPGFTPM